MIKIKDKYVGWIQAFVLVFIFWGLSNVFLSFATQIININKFIFTSVTFFSCSFCLLAYAKNGKLSRETMLSADTWLFGFVMIFNYIVALNLFSLLPPTEVTMLQRLNVVFSLFIGWFFLKRKPSKWQLLGMLFVMIGLYYVVRNIHSENNIKVYIFMVLSPLAQSLRVFAAELHRTHKKAATESSIKSRCRVVGYIMFTVSLLFLLLLIGIAYINSLAVDKQFLLPVTFNDFYNYKSILLGTLMGIIIYTPTRYLEFSAAEKIKTENFLAVGALSFFATWFWQVLLQPLTKLETSNFTNQDIISGVIITAGALIMAVSKILGVREDKEKMDPIKIKNITH